MALYDLSHPYQDQMPVYPGDHPVRLTLQRSVPEDGFTAYLLAAGLHAGTHLDAPLHFVEGGQMVQDLPLELFAGRGRLLDVRGQNPIAFRAEYAKLIEAGDVVLLWTGHSDRWGTDTYFSEHPVVHGELAEFFVARRIRLLGMDLPSPDGPPFAIHKKLLGAGIPLLENLTNLKQLAEADSFEVMAFPLKIAAEGCPVRVVARTLCI
ncbi:MAG TPA: cyclase family protein [Limnochordia bacterium]|nr:cyclase family protein [Limnochordia bacterium]